MTDRYFTSLLSDDEEVVFATRQHWLVLLAEILSETVLAVAFAFLITLAWRFWNPHPLMPYAYLILILPAASLIWDVLRWRKRQFVVTGRRVIEIGGILNKDVTDSSLEKVNDIRLSQSFLGRMFDYGNVEILTASEAGVSRFQSVHGPIRLKTAMLNAKDRLERTLSGGGRPAPGGDVIDLIAQLGSLRDHGVLSEAELQQKKAELLSRL